MSGISKRVSGSWVSGDYGIMKTATDTITTLPADIYADGNNATVGLKGNTVQNGTPTPDNPIMPQGTGDRTGNVFDKDNATPVSLYYQEQREIIATNQYVVSIIIPVSPNTTYTFNNPAGNRNRICETETIPEMNDTVINYISSDDNVSITLTTSNDTHYILWWVGYQLAYSDIANTLSVNLGSTALPYEPYGYKIPISSGGTTTNVFLGEVQTTRKIRKLVLTGDEDWEQVTAGDNTYIRLDIGVLNTYIGDAIVCTHCGYANISSSTSGYGCDILNSVKSNRDFLCFRLQGYQGNTIFKQYLEAQYATGTPVCVWYELATPQTAVVNEPLMRVGDYADTLSNISIPVTAGGDTLSVGTTVQPSEVTVNYKGWHPVADVHERDNGAWT